MPAVAEETTLRLRVIYVDPPGPPELDAAFGLQDRVEGIHAGRREGADAVYDLEVAARWDPGRQRLRFRGPWVQGKPDEPFLYVSWRRARPGDEPAGWLCRAKISLTGITLSQVERARHAPESVLVIRVPGRGPRGGPSAASLRPIEDWTLVTATDFAPIPPP
jgi:hypothetical protein